MGAMAMVRHPKKVYIICDECKQPITQNKFALFDNKAAHVDFNQCFRALNGRIRKLNARIKELETTLYKVTEDA